MRATVSAVEVERAKGRLVLHGGRAAQGEDAELRAEAPVAPPAAVLVAQPPGVETAKSVCVSGKVELRGGSAARPRSPA